MSFKQGLFAGCFAGFVLLVVVSCVVVSLIGFALTSVKEHNQLSPIDAVYQSHSQNDIIQDLASYCDNFTTDTGTKVNTIDVQQSYTIRTGKQSTKITFVMDCETGKVTVNQE